MSICSNTLRASSRWRVPASKTLLPFLYQTPTIQQWKPAAQRIAHRNASSRSNHDNDIPFEDETLPTPVNQVESSRKTTITGSERAAFEKLYKKFNAQGRPQDDNHHEPELDQIADEYYEDDDDGSTVSLDSLFDAVLQNSSYLRETSPRKPNPNLKKNKGLSLTAVAENMVHPALDRVKEQSRNLAQADAAALKLRMMQERTRVNTMIRNAQTDREVWEVLDREVFAVVRTLDLDNLRKSVKTASGSIKSKMQDTYLAKEAEKYKISLPRFSGLPPDNPQSPPRLEASVSDPRIFFPNYPHHIVVAVQTLRKSFPTSPLPLYILPIIKSLGRSSYALGATTDLYKQLLYNAWLQHSSYSQIDSLLTDMDNGGIEFDANILRLLDLILAEYQRARIGRYGRTLQLVLGTEQYEEGRKKLQIWREMIASRLGDWASSRPQRRTLVRKVDPLAKDKSFTRHVGPRDEISFRTSQKRRESSKGERE